LQKRTKKLSFALQQPAVETPESPKPTESFFASFCTQKEDLAAFLARVPPGR
jgi:hypothetical protein